MYIYSFLIYFPILMFPYLYKFLILCLPRTEEKYKSYERLKEQLEVLLGWCSSTKDNIDNPPQVLIQLKEVSRLKAQRQVRHFLA